MNDAPIIDYTDAAILPEGAAGFAASSKAVLRIDDFAIYGIPMVNAPIT